MPQAKASSSDPTTKGHKKPRFDHVHRSILDWKTKEQLHEERREITDRELDTFACVSNRCAIEELQSPRSNFGKEAKQLHEEKLTKAETERVAAEKREKRRLSKKAYRQRKAAAKKGSGDSSN